MPSMQAGSLLGSDDTSYAYDGYRVRSYSCCCCCCCCSSSSSSLLRLLMKYSTHVKKKKVEMLTLLRGCKGVSL